MDIKACIFDFEGVMIDTANYHYLAWKQLAEKPGARFTEKDNERLKRVSRVDSPDIIPEKGDMNIFNKEKEKLADEKNEQYMGYILKMTPDDILPGARDFLNEVKEAGILTVLGTASKNAKTIFKKINLLNTFNVIVDGTIINAAKLDLFLFFTCAELLHVTPSSCIVFEGTVAGIEAAHRAGMKRVGVGYPDIMSIADLIIDGFKNFRLKNIVFH